MATTAPRTNGRALHGVDAPDPEAPPLPAWLDSATQAFWGALSAARAARIFHPIGEAYDATLTVPAHGRGKGHGVQLLDMPGEHRAIVRVSRGAGLPRPIPDALGLAIRLPDVHGRNKHQDFLFVTSGNGPLLQHLILPAPLRWRQPLSSVLAYRVGGRLRVFGAQRRGEGAFDLCIASLHGRFKKVARLDLGPQLPAAVSEGLRFNVWHSGGGIRPVGPFQRLRDPAYRGSQRGRGAA